MRAHSARRMPDLGLTVKLNTAPAPVNGRIAIRHGHLQRSLGVCEDTIRVAQELRSFRPRPERQFPQQLQGYNHGDEYQNEQRCCTAFH